MVSLLFLLVCGLYVCVTGAVFAYIVHDGSMVEYDELKDAMLLAWLWPFTVPVLLIGLFILYLVDRYR